MDQPNSSYVSSMTQQTLYHWSHGFYGFSSLFFINSWLCDVSLLTTTMIQWGEELNMISSMYLKLMLCISDSKVLNLILLDVFGVFKQVDVSFYFHCIYSKSFYAY